MAKAYDRPITIQRMDENTEKWEDICTRHAYINKARADAEYLAGGAVQGHRTLTFELRYYPGIEHIGANMQNHRIMYAGKPYNITDYDDFGEKHINVKMAGVSY